MKPNIIRTIIFALLLLIAIPLAAHAQTWVVVRPHTHRRVVVYERQPYVMYQRPYVYRSNIYSYPRYNRYYSYRYTQPYFANPYTYSYVNPAYRYYDYGRYRRRHSRFRLGISWR